MKQATIDALAWLAEDTTRTPYKAAKKFDIQQSTITRALRRNSAKKVCPTCGAVSYNAGKKDKALPHVKNGRVDTSKLFGGDELV